MFNITSVTADSSNTVIRLGWAYTITEGSLGGEHTLQLPAGSKPLADLTKAASTHTP